MFIKHGTVVGVSDPTGHIPCGHVFLTGMDEQTPSEVFLTRVSNMLFVYVLVVQYHLISLPLLSSIHAPKARMASLQKLQPGKTCQKNLFNSWMG
jgi:hypothetical protein